MINLNTMVFFLIVVFMFVRNLHKLEPLTLTKLFTRNTHKTRIAATIRTQVKKRAHKNNATSSQHT
jgi:hypothetical protein